MTLIATYDNHYGWDPMGESTPFTLPQNRNFNDLDVFFGLEFFILILYCPLLGAWRRAFGLFETSFCMIHIHLNNLLDIWVLLLITLYYDDKSTIKHDMQHLLRCVFELFFLCNTILPFLLRLSFIKIIFVRTVSIM